MSRSVCCLLLMAILIVATFYVSPVCAGAFWDIHGVDTTATLGGHLSIAVDSKDNLHIAYIVTETGSSYTSSNRSLAIASWDGSSWNIQKIAKGAGVGYAAMVFDSNGNLCVTYTSGPIEDNDTGVITYYLRIAVHTESGWEIETVGEGISGSIALDSLSNPHIAYMGTNGLLKYASWSGSNWTTQTVGSGSERAFSIKMVQYLALDSEDCPHIVYNVDSSVNYATHNSSGWEIQTVLSNYSGRIGNLVLDSNNIPHFTCAINGSIMYTLA
ncbi:MAG: hypothetical protein NWF05_05615 [Candidatus Bathyarchaeota archaeon]|nr:hypothetical protein [Candidatus Bathyarchaeota archaeon]